MSVKTFMASMTQTVESGRTDEPTVTKGGASGALEAKKVPTMGLSITTPAGAAGGGGAASGRGPGAGGGGGGAGGGGGCAGAGGRQGGPGPRARGGALRP